MLIDNKANRAICVDTVEIALTVACVLSYKLAISINSGREVGAMAVRRMEPGDEDGQATSSKKPAARIGKQMIGAYLTTANVEKIRAVVWRRQADLGKRVTMQDAVFEGLRLYCEKYAKGMALDDES